MSGREPRVSLRAALRVWQAAVGYPDDGVLLPSDLAVGEWPATTGRVELAVVAAPSSPPFPRRDSVQLVATSIERFAGPQPHTDTSSPASIANAARSSTPSAVATSFAVAPSERCAAKSTTGTSMGPCMPTAGKQRLSTTARAQR